MSCMYTVQMVMEITLLLVAFLSGITAAIAIGIVRVRIYRKMQSNLSYDHHIFKK